MSRRLYFILHICFSQNIGNHWNSFGRRVVCSDLHLKIFILAIVWKNYAMSFIRVKISLIVTSPLSVFEMLKLKGKKKITSAILKCHQLTVRCIPISEVLKYEKMYILEYMKYITGWQECKQEANRRWQQSHRWGLSVDEAGAIGMEVNDRLLNVGGRMGRAS